MYLFSFAAVFFYNLHSQMVYYARTVTAVSFQLTNTYTVNTASSNSLGILKMIELQKVRIEGSSYRGFLLGDFQGT